MPPDGSEAARFYDGVAAEDRPAAEGHAAPADVEVRRGRRTIDYTAARRDTVNGGEPGRERGPRGDAATAHDPAVDPQHEPLAPDDTALHDAAVQFDTVVADESALADVTALHAPLAADEPEVDQLGAQRQPVTAAEPALDESAAPNGAASDRVIWHKSGRADVDTPQDAVTPDKAATSGEAAEHGGHYEESPTVELRALTVEEVPVGEDKPGPDAPVVGPAAEPDGSEDVKPTVEPVGHQSIQWPPRKPIAAARPAEPTAAAESSAAAEPPTAAPAEPIAAAEPPTAAPAEPIAAAEPPPTAEPPSAPPAPSAPAEPIAAAKPAPAAEPPAESVYRVETSVAAWLPADPVPPAGRETGAGGREPKPARSATAARALRRVAGWRGNGSPRLDEETPTANEPIASEPGAKPASRTAPRWVRQRPSRADRADRAERPARHARPTPETEPSAQPTPRAPRAKTKATHNPTQPFTPADAPLGFRDRGRVRQRARYLRHLREVQIRDLGGFVLELYRFDKWRGDLVGIKLAEVAETDRALRALDSVLGEERSLREVREAGIGGVCSRCGTIHGSVDRFCAACGAPVAPGSVERRPARTRGRRTR